ncbi:hypothetical protein SKAU_G00193310 [Synaphobranchus kaupii]|uniref:Uncharacterized protein n=1 Tax=Synaphobranchus kaupii TaxID=118154 RepID=A0A9Q1FE72_SYNKA|nr:hypothetical protein SKAU_G00193310 [Synaphobranchus kaupii]
MSCHHQEGEGSKCSAPLSYLVVELPPASPLGPNNEDAGDHRLSRIRISCHPPLHQLSTSTPCPRPLIHPLVASGDISVDLAEILMESDYKKKRVASLWLRGLLQERSSSGSSGNGKKRSRQQLPLKSSGPSCEGVKWSSWPRGSELLWQLPAPLLRPDLEPLLGP